MINITIIDFIIATLVISFCVSAIIGTLVYCILKKKHDIVECHKGEGEDSL